MKTLQELDLSGLKVLDGAMATQLEAMGCNLDGPLWSAHVLGSSPETIAAVHREYLEAGADCLLTASYQISAEGFQEIGRSPEEAADALRQAVSIAEEVRRSYQAGTPRRVWIAASLGPYGAALHNGAEYHGNYDCGFDDLIRFHTSRLAVLAETNADFIAFETIPSHQEARAIVAALHPFPGLPASLTFTCKDAAHVAHGERLSDCARLLDAEAQIIGIGVNCTNPKFIRPLIGELVAVTRKPIIVYPNSGEHWDVEHQQWVGEGEARNFGELAADWRRAGAEWIGGCCRTGPEHIRAVRRQLADQKSQAGQGAPESRSPTIRS
jgi:homocysteine S-methyltransferase